MADGGSGKDGGGILAGEVRRHRGALAGAGAASKATSRGRERRSAASSRGRGCGGEQRDTGRVQDPIAIGIRLEVGIFYRVLKYFFRVKYRGYHCK